MSNLRFYLKQLRNALRTPRLGGRVLLYHRVNFDPDPLGLTVSLTNFEDQIAWLNSHYKVCSLAEFLQCDSNDGKAAITFDDGYRDNLINALPILQKYNCPATIFVSCGLINRTASMWWEELKYLQSRCGELTIDGHSYSLGELCQLCKNKDPQEVEDLLQKLRKNLGINSFSYEDLVINEDELKILDNEQLISIGLHTQNHVALHTLSDIELREEIYQSKKQLESWLGHPVNHMSYPYGEKIHINERVLATVKEANFKAAFSTQYGFITSESNPLKLPRIVISGHDDLPDFIAKVK